MSAGPARFASVDALRGITVAAMLLVNNPGDWGHVYAPLLHAPWHGCTPTDLIFPFFLFVVGVSIALGIVPRAETPAARPALRRAACWRALRIVAIGLLLHWLAWWLLDRAHYRPWGVLQRIGLCFLAAALAALYLKPRMQWLLAAGLLLGYWALLAAGGSLAPYDNMAARIDTLLAGPHLYRFDPDSGRGYDPEGLASTLPAIATTLAGLRAGEWLRRGARGTMLGAGFAAALLGALWSLWLPLNKSLWTPSFVLWTAGWALLALLACHVLVDLRGWPALGRRFGTNAIAAFAGSAAMVYVLIAGGWWGALYRQGVAAWLVPLAGERASSLVFALAFVALWWGVVYAMDRRGWSLKA